MQTTSPLHDLLEAIDACAAESRRIAVESAHIAACLLQINEPDAPQYVTITDVDAYIATIPAPFWE